MGDVLELEPYTRSQSIHLEMEKVELSLPNYSDFSGAILGAVG